MKNAIVPNSLSSTPWLTLPEACVYSRTGKRLLYSAVQAGDVRHVRIGGRRELRFKSSWLDEWLESRVER